MKKIWRYSLCLACTLALSLCSAPAGALAVEPGSVDDGAFVVENGVLIDYTGEETDIVIPDSLGIVKIGSYLWCISNEKPLRSLVIPEGVTEIGGSAFAGSELTHISLPSTLKVIGPSAFEGCSQLKSIHLPEGLEEIQSAAFYRSGIESIHIPNTVKILGSGVFGYCPLHSISLPGGITEMGVTLFEWCDQLNTITIQPGITSLPLQMIMSCFKLEELVIPEGVTRISADFLSGCPSLKRLVLPDTVTEMGTQDYFVPDTLVYYRDNPAIDASVQASGLTRGYFGDVNSDGRLNSSDARLVLQHTVELVDLSPAERLIADISDDGEVNSTDARRILQAAVAG